MNLYLRLLWLILRLPFVRRRDPLAPACLRLRVWPNDCDLNLHLNNGRYLTFMDLGRTQLVAQIGLLRPIFRHGWQPVLAAADVNFIRPLAPLVRFELVTRLVSWDEKYFYMEQRFERGGTLHALAFVKGVFLKGRLRVPTSNVVAAVDASIAPPPLPAALRHWNEMTELKKRHTALHEKQAA